MISILEHINWDPMIFKVAGPLALRWYGLMYVLAFAIGYYVLRWLRSIGYLRVTVEDCTNIIIVGVLGTFIGGRLGHLLFYEFDKFILNRGNENPIDLFWQALQVWKGGMSFHGGVIGVVTAEFIFAWRRKLWLWNLGDACVHVVPIGITSVRFGNYINGELYGRVITDAAGKPIMEADKLPWYAMKFPTDHNSPGYRDLLHAMREDWYKAHPEAKEIPADWSVLPVKPEIWQQYEPLFYGRYPSQLVQMFFEGFILLVSIWILRKWCKRPGVLGSIFLIGYAIFRIPAEIIREPDQGLDPAKDADLGGTAAFLSSIGLTMGQLLSVLLIAFGTVQLFIFLRPKKSITGGEYRPWALRWLWSKQPAMPKGAPIGPPSPEEHKAGQTAEIAAEKPAEPAKAETAKA